MHLGVRAFLLFGVGLGRLGALAAEPQYRPPALHRHRLLPVLRRRGLLLRQVHQDRGGQGLPERPAQQVARRSPGPLLIVTPIATLLYRATLTGTLHNWQHCITLGLLTAALAQLGDLVISSIKRDIGVKDMAQSSPATAASSTAATPSSSPPAVYHYITAVGGHSTELPLRLLTSP